MRIGKQRSDKGSGHSPGCGRGVAIRRGAGAMVKIHVKSGDTSQFLFETTVEIPTAELIPQLVRLYNGRLKIDRLCQGALVLTI